MPPHFPLEEEYQTKEWALATIDTLFSDNAPISFEPCGPINVEYKSSNNNNTYNYTSSQHTIVNNTEPMRQTRRAQSALDMNYLNKQCSSLISRPPSTASYASDPVLPYTIPLSLPPANMQRSLSDRLRRRLTPEGSQLKSKLTTYKEKEGVDIWKKTYQEYISNANMVSRIITSSIIHAKKKKGD
jgi:hypothetical protein